MLGWNDSYRNNESETPWYTRHCYEDDLKPYNGNQDYREEMFYDRYSEGWRRVRIRND